MKHVFRNNIFYFFYFLNILVKNSQFQKCLTKTCKDKNSYYYSFKTQLGSRSWAKLGSLVEAQVTGWVYLSQCNGKSSYHRSFKTRFKPGSPVKRVDPEQGPVSKALI
jgi:hypothetical protein